MNFANNIQYLRKKAGMSQEQLAEKLDVTRQSVSKWESGQTYPEMDKLSAICKMFRCDLDTLVNGNVMSDPKQNGFFKKIFDDFINMMEGTAKMVSKMNFKQIIKFIIQIALIVLIIIILKLPFIMLENLFSRLLYNFNDVGKVLVDIWHYIVEIAYVLMAFLAFFYIYKAKFFGDDNVTKKVVNYFEKDGEDISEEPVKEIAKYQGKEKEKFSLLNLFVDIIVFFIKVFAFFVLCFGMMIIVFLSVCLAMSVILVFSGVPILGILFGSIGCLSLAVFVAELLFNFIFNRQNNWTKSFITFIGSLIIIGVGVSVSFINISSFTYNANVPPYIEKNVAEKTITMNNNILFGEGIDLYDIDYVVDDKLNNDIKIKIEYYDKFVKAHLSITNNVIDINRQMESLNANKMFDMIINDMKQKNIYFYSDLDDIKITISGSSKNVESLKEIQNKREVIAYQDEVDRCNQERTKEQAKLDEYESKIEELKESNQEIKEKYDELKQRVKEIVE